MRGAGKKRRTNSGYRHVLVCLGLCIMITGCFLRLNQRYRDMNREKYAKKLNYYSACMKREKRWIAGQQSVEGALCLYEITESAKGTVVPYFSCQAALGLLAGTPTEEELHMVADYLSWHAKELVKHEGIVSDQEIIEGKLVSKETQDSVDSYLALYFTLLATYARKGGDLSEIPDAEKSVETGTRKLAELTNRGLTKVSETKEIYYFMDNLEVLEAYENMDVLMNSGDRSVEAWDQKEQITDFFYENKAKSKKAIRAVFWNEGDRRFEVGADVGFHALEFRGMDKLYPDAVAQVYPLACGVELIEKENEQVLYEQLSKQHAWVTLEQGTTFEWPVLSYIALQMGDVRAAETYVKNYYRKYNEDRSYPYKVTDAAWVVRTCGRLYDYYEEKADRDLVDAICERIENITGKQESK